MTTPRVSPRLEPLEDRTLLAVLMDLPTLRQLAFSLSQTTFAPPNPPPIAALDPPATGRPESVGLVFQEALAIRAKNLLDQQDFYFQPRPRASTDKLPLAIFVDFDRDGRYDPRTYEDAMVDYSSPVIQPPINPTQLPPAGKVLSRLIVGHRQPDPGGDRFPQFFDLGADGYARFNGFFPQTVGASFRIAAHRVFMPNEDFPIVREVYASVVNPQTANFLVLVDSEGFTGAVSIDITPTPETRIGVDATWFPRRDIRRAEEPETGFVAYSSLFWKGERDTPEIPIDEAHDSDILVAGFDRNGDGLIDRIAERSIRNPPNQGELVLTDLSGGPNERLVYWSLENRDRDPAHYWTYAAAEYARRASYAVQFLETGVPLGLHLHEQRTDSEFLDNIVANAVILGDLPRAQSLAGGIRIRYVATAFYPDDSDADGLTDFLERNLGTDPRQADTDRDGKPDGDELREGTCPSNRCFVAQVYLDLLQRPVDTVGLEVWTNQLDQRVRSRAQVVLDITNSQEYRTVVVGQLYRTLLGREADRNGQDFFIRMLNAGATMAHVKAMILGSGEYFNRAGGTNDRFLEAVYRDVLSRPLDPTGRDAWIGALARGASRQDVAAQIVTSREGHEVLVRGLYLRFLRRVADTVGLNHFATLLQNGTREEQVIADILGSAEYPAQL